MSTRAHLVVVLIAALPALFILRLVRRRALRAKYSLLWLAVGAVLVLTALFPGLVDHACFEVEGGRHPVVEEAVARAGGRFVANDCMLSESSRLWLVTGPNMGGKSTFLRQNALIAVLAQAAFDSLPEPFRGLAAEAVVRIDDYADQETLDALGIEDVFELTGLYQGVDLGRRSVLDYGTEPSRVFLYRRPILDEWAERGDVPLGELITHVLVHEIGHHFGLSDDDIHRIEDEE